MSTRMSKYLVVLAFGWAATASATLMPPVSVNGQQWLQPLDFVSNSWNEIALVCDISTGACSGSLNGYDLTGWTWASVTNLNAVFKAFGIPGFEDTAIFGSLAIDTSAASLWAPLFLESFQPTRPKAIAGLLRTAQPSQTSWGIVADDATSIFAGQIWDIANTFSGAPGPDDTSENIGSWFYREQSEVPISATIPLLALGLAALGYGRRIRKQQI